MKVRPATTDADRMALFRLCVAFHKETHFSEFPLNPMKVLNHLQWWTTHIDALALLAMHDTAGPVGFFLGKVAPPWFADDLTAIEDAFYVLPEHRGSRAAYMLVREFVAWGKARGARHCRAGVSSGAGRAGERLYEHFGMVNMGANFVAHWKE